MAIVKYCKLSGDQIIWVEYEKNKAVRRFLNSDDAATSYLIMYDGIKKNIYDVMEVGDSIKKYDTRLRKFIKFPKFYYAYVNEKRVIESISELPNQQGVCLLASTALYYYDSRLPLPVNTDYYM